MCEFLVKNKKHWSEEVDTAEKNTWSLKKIRFMGASSRIGDIIACRKDETYKNTDKFNPSFCVVRVPSMNLEEGYTYVTSIYGNEGEIHVVRKRRYRIDCSEQFETLNYSQFKSRVQDKMETEILIMNKDW